MIDQVEQMRSLPYSDEAEITVLGGMFLDKDAADLALEMLVVEDFYHSEHKCIFAAIKDLRDADSLADPLSVKDQLDRTNNLDSAGGESYLARIIDIVPTAANTKHAALRVGELAIRRRLIRELSAVVDHAYNQDMELEDLVDEAERRVLAATSGRSATEMVSVKDTVTEALRVALSGKRRSIPTGFSALDEVIGGLGPGELTILAARPSMGKSALASQIAMNVASKGIPVGFFSLEMSRDSCTLRMLALKASVNLDWLTESKTYMLRSYDYDNLAKAEADIKQLPLFVDDNSYLSIFQLRARARRHKQRHDIGLLVVDYLQLMEGAGGKDANRTQEVGSISRGLKRLAGELKIPVLALAQLNRAVESRENKRPHLSDLRDSGEIEQDADRVLFLYRPSYYADPGADSGLAQVLVAKQRNGPLGTVDMRFEQRYVRFSEWTGIGSQGWDDTSSESSEKT